MKQSLLSFVSICLSLSGAASAALTDSSLETHVGSLTLSSSFSPVKEAYWTGLPHHRRTPFAVSPDGTKAYLAYLDASGTDVHVQPVDPTTFAATGTVTTVTGGKEAGGLVAHDDGFALLTNEAMPTSTTNAPPSSTPVAVLYRFDASGTQTFKTWLGGPSINDDMGHMSSPDMNGDLVYSSVTGQYAAYIVVTAYDGEASGHYGDAIRYVSGTGAIVDISGASSGWGCSHNTGIALEAADAAPYASICAEDQGAIWLNSQGQGMTTAGVKISNENTTNGADGEPMGGMSGSYSNLARFTGSAAYIFAWVSRGATTLSANTWMGDGYTTALNRTNGRNVAVATFSDKYTLTTAQASSTVGDTDGDKQVNWVTTGGVTTDMSNAHAAAFDASNALVTWEEISDPICEVIAFGCRGTFTGSYFQQVDSTGAKVGSAISSTDVYVAGDMVTMADGRICWPYVSMKWDLSQAVAYQTIADVTAMSFACMNLDGTSASTTGAASSSAVVASSSAAVASSSAAAVSSAAPAASSGNVAIPEVSSSAAAVAAPTTLAATSSAAAVTAPAASTSTVRSRKSRSSKPAATSSAAASSASAAANDAAPTTLQTSALQPSGAPFGPSNFTLPAFGSGTGAPGAAAPTRRPCALKRRQAALEEKAREQL